MKTTIYLIRHGQTETNVTNKFVGHTDIALTELGKRQAQRTAEYLRDKHIDVFYSSDLQRAYYTAGTAAALYGKSVTTDPAFREMNMGRWEGLDQDTIMQQFPEEWNTWKTRLGEAHVQGGESTQSVMDRTFAALERIVQAHPGKTIAIASHGMALQCLCTALQGWSRHRVTDLPIASNASVTTVEHENGRYTITDYAHDAHLGDMVTCFVVK